MVWIVRALTLMILTEAFLIILIGFAWIIRTLWNELIEWGKLNEKKSIGEPQENERSDYKKL
jgi:hypothetical protein